MAKLFGFEMEAPEIESAGKWVNTILNSRIGLALLIWGTFQFSLAPKLDTISKDTGEIAAHIEEAKHTCQDTHQVLMHLQEQCPVDLRTKSQTTAYRMH